MAYRIEYFNGGVEIGSTICNGSCEEAKAEARRGLTERGGNFVRLVDADGSGAEVWSERNDA